jgi:RimJ/RimL family protein N-acetyltransferase
VREHPAASGPLEDGASLRSLGYRTDLMFARYDGEVTERADYVVVRTPSNPSFWWGNFLLFRSPPAPGDLGRWRDAFAREIGEGDGGAEAVRHMTFGIDSPDGDAGDVAPFLEAGFEVERNVVLTATSVRPPARPNGDVEIRPVRTAAEWQAVLENKVEAREPWHDRDAYERYEERQLARYRRMIADGRGQWFGAFLAGRLTADLGVFGIGGVARFQSVVTHPDFRRRGICGTLVHASASWAFRELGATTLVMVADPEYHAARIYESVGFEPTERQVGLELRPRGTA